MELHDLATGPVSPAAALIFAALGSLLGVLLVTRARRRTGLRRVRLVLYAVLAVALPAIWLPGLIAVLALRVDGSVLRLNLEPLGSSLGVAAGATMLALLPVCSGRPGVVRQVLAGLFLVGAIGGTGYYLSAALATGAPIVAHPTSVGLAIALACVTAFGLAGALATSRSLRLAAGHATLLGLGLAGIYHIAAAALRVEPGPGGPIPADDVPGLATQRIGLPSVVTVAVILALIWYFAIGPATMRDLRLIFEPGSENEQIEPWMVEQVRTRVSLSSTAYAPVPGWPDVWVRSEPTVAVHAIQIGGGIADAFNRAWPGRTHREPAAIERTSASPIPPPPGAEDASAWPSAELADRTVPAADRTVDSAIPTDQTVPADRATPTDHPVPADRSMPADSAGLADRGFPPEEPVESTGVPWRSVPSWGLPTAQWSRAELEDALGGGPSGDPGWPAPGRNEAGVTRRARPAAVNSRFGPLPNPTPHPGTAAPERSPGNQADPAYWMARLHAARAAAEEDGPGAVIVREYEAGTPLPRRNARPISRP